MVNLVLTEQVALTFLNIWHVLAGIYIWEFFTTLNYEWRVIRGRLPYRWTIWIYSLTRVACLVGLILAFAGVDFLTPIHCQIWVSFVSTLTCASAAGASLLIALRIFAMWNRNKFVMAIAIVLWGIGAISHIQSIARLRSAWDPAHHSCIFVPTKGGVIGIIPTIFADLALLPILLAGLVLLRRRDGGTFGLSSLVWRQGVVWLLLAFMSEAPLAVVAVMSSNEQFIDMLLPLGVIAMVIAATRMHRTLVDYASGSPDIVLENLELGSGVAFSRSKAARTASISPPNRIEHEKPSVRSLGDEVLERDV